MIAVVGPVVAGLVFALMGVLASKQLSSMAATRVPPMAVTVDARDVTFEREVDPTVLMNQKVDAIGAVVDATARVIERIDAEAFIERVHRDGFSVIEAPLACGVLADDLGWLLDAGTEQTATIFNGDAVTSVAVYPLPSDGLFLYAEQSLATGGLPDGLCTARVRDDRPLLPFVGVDPGPF